MVKLEAIMQRDKAFVRHDPSLAEAARAPHGVARRQVQRLDTAVTDAIPAGRAHSEVTDTQRVLERLVARLETILAQLGEAAH